MARGTYISIITLNVNGLNHPTKDTDWLNGYKTKIHIHTVYKKPTLDLKTHIDWQWEDGKIYSMQMGSKKKTGIPIFITNKIGLKIKTITGDKDGHYIMINPRGRHNNCKYLCTQHRSTSIQKTNTNRHKRKTWCNTIRVGDFNAPLTPMDRSSKQKINKETQVLNDTLIRWISLISSGHSIQMQKNTPSSQVHMEHFQDRPHLGSQIKYQ